jgi:hypothetical protein
MTRLYNKQSRENYTDAVTFCDTLSVESPEYIMNACACHIGLRDQQAEIDRIQAALKVRTDVEDALWDAVKQWKASRANSVEGWLKEIIVSDECINKGARQFSNIRCNKNADHPSINKRASKEYIDSASQSYWNGQNGCASNKWSQLCKRETWEAEYLALYTYNNHRLRSPGDKMTHPFWRTGEVWSEFIDTESLKTVNEATVHTAYESKLQHFQLLLPAPKVVYNFNFTCCSNSINCNEGSDCTNLDQKCIINSSYKEEVDIENNNDEISGEENTTNVAVVTTSNNYIVFGVGAILLILIALLIRSLLTNQVQPKQV